MSCPCGSQKEFAACCEPYLEGRANAPTPEALMRSRYTAFATARIPYLKATMAPEKQKEFDERNARQWATGSAWLGLHIISAKENGDTGVVEFVASYRQQGLVRDHHERAKFRKEDGKWYFVDGYNPDKQKEQKETPKVKTFVRTEQKVGRNEPCPCGSGKKYKHCCANK